MIEGTSHSRLKSSSNESFGMLFALVFLIVAAWPLLDGKAVRTWALAVSGLFILVAMLWPRLLRTPNALWMRLGLALGAVVTPLVMAVLYYGAFLPMGLVMRARGYDPLRLKREHAAASYWMKRERRNSPASSMKSQF
jgi:Saxitoxin biosynthesis operon protein SxtJ